MYTRLKKSFYVGLFSLLIVGNLQTVIAQDTPISPFLFDRYQYLNLGGESSPYQPMVFFPFPLNQSLLEMINISKEQFNLNINDRIPSKNRTRWHFDEKELNTDFKVLEVKYLLTPKERLPYQNIPPEFVVKTFLLHDAQQIKGYSIVEALGEIDLLPGTIQKLKSENTLNSSAFQEVAAQLQGLDPSFELMTYESRREGFLFQYVFAKYGEVEALVAESFFPENQEERFKPLISNTIYNLLQFWVNAEN